MNKFIRGMFADSSVGKKILLLISIFILLEMAGSVIGLGIGELGKLMSISQANIFRLQQLFASSVSFIGTPLIFFYLVAKPQCSFMRFFKLDKSNRLTVYLLAVVALFACLPLVNYTASINEQMTFPESLNGLESALKGMEDLAKKLTIDLLKTDSAVIFCLNIIVVALAPAIGEELLFRGALQGTLQKKFSPIVAIFITSIIFSALHLQFYGFVPRVVLSILLGLLFYYSGSIRLNMFVHFLNNALSVVAFYICTIKNISIDDTPAETVGKEDITPTVIATLISAVAIWGIYKIANRKKEEEENENNDYNKLQDNNDQEPTQPEEISLEDREDENRFMPQ